MEDYVKIVIKFRKPTMLLIHRTITKEILISFIIPLIGLNIILMMEKILKLSRILTGIGATFYDFLKIVVFIQPQLLLFTIPLGFFVSVLITYGRMNMDNEIVALRASGMDFHSLYRPVFIISGVLLILSFSVSLYIMPKAHSKLRDTLNNLLRERAIMAIEPGVFYNSFKGLMILVKDKKPNGEYRGIFLYDESNRKQSKMIFAKRGRIITDNAMKTYFKLTDGLAHLVENKTSTVIKFKEYILNLTIEDELMRRKKNDMSIKELLENARNKQNKNRLDYYIELHRRLSFPVLIVIFAMLAPPLSLVSGRTGKLSGLFIGLSVFSIYYMILLYFENLVRTNRLYHLFCWAPLIMLAIIAIIMYRKRNG